MLKCTTARCRLPSCRYLFYTFLCSLQELSDRSDTQYVAGGATQNSIRIAQWLLQVPGATSYFGCVGSDNFADTMRETAQKDGVNVRFA